MIIPIRCFTCGKVIANKYETYLQRLSDGEKAKTILDDMNMKRYCCRRMFLTHVDLIDQLLEYNTAMGAKKTAAHK